MSGWRIPSIMAGCRDSGMVRPFCEDVKNATAFLPLLNWRLEESVKFRNCTRKPLFSNSPIAPICVYAWMHGHTNASTRVHTR